MSTNTMKAIRLHEFGGPEVLRYEEVPIPELKPGEVLVRVHSVGINPPDWYLRDGFTILPPAWRPPVPLPIIPGTDVSGIVEAVAADVHGFSVGDEVFGMIRFPSLEGGAAYAEYVSAPASDLALKPAGIDHVHAAGAPMAGLTGWQFLIELDTINRTRFRRNYIARCRSPARRCSSMAPRAEWGTSPCSWLNGRVRA